MEKIVRERPRHLILYDGTCGLCDNTVQFIFNADKKGLFAYAPLQGQTAGQFIHKIPDENQSVDSVILVENFQSNEATIEVESKAIFRIFWLLGGFWAPLGIFSYLPSWFFDWGYRLVAKHRYDLWSRRCLIPPKQHRDRFLP